MPKNIFSGTKLYPPFSRGLISKRTAAALAALARFYRPGGGGFELFLPGGWGIRPSKNCLGVLPGGGDGQAWN